MKFKPSKFLIVATIIIVLAPILGSFAATSYLKSIDRYDQIKDPVSKEEQPNEELPQEDDDKEPVVAEKVDLTLMLPDLSLRTLQIASFNDEDGAQASVKQQNAPVFYTEVSGSYKVNYTAFTSTDASDPIMELVHETHSDAFFGKYDLTGHEITFSVKEGITEEDIIKELENWHKTLAYADDVMAMLVRNEDPGVVQEEVAQLIGEGPYTADESLESIMGKTREVLLHDYEDASEFLKEYNALLQNILKLYKK